MANFGDKPRKDYQSLGDNTTVKVEGLEPDLWARNTLTEVGKSMCESGFKHLGSAAFHVYATDTVLAVAGELQIKSQVQLGDLSEAAANLATVEFIKRVAASYRGERRSIDPAYKVDGAL